jgi:hypothetical protein
VSGLFDWLTPQVGAVKVPEGDPGSLRSAANTFVSAAEGMEAAGSRVESTASAIAGGTWYGAAALAFTGSCRSIAGDCEAAGGAFRASAAVLGRLAEELQAAQELAKNAQQQAADLNAASSRLDNAFADAQRIESAPRPEGAPPVQSAIPGLVVQAGGLNIQALGINAQAAQAEQLAIDAAAKAAGAFDEIAGMAPSVRRAAAARAAAAHEAAQKEEDDDKGFWETVATPFVWSGKQVANVAVGAYDGVKDPLVMVYNLTPLHGGWTDEWGRLADGVSYGWHHPGEFARAVIGIDMLEERGFSYWLGNVAPSAVAAFYTGGGSAAIRGSSGASRLTRAADNVDELGDLARFGGAAAVAQRPAWLQRVQKGSAFDDRWDVNYPYRQLYLDAGDGRMVRLDSYSLAPNEIVSRKYSQLGDVQEGTAISYLDELDRKYAPLTEVADVPSTRARYPELVGQRIDGDMILEVPPQHSPIPQSVLDHADELDITIRDVTGRVYNGLDDNPLVAPRVGGAALLGATGADRTHELVAP